MKVRVLIAYGSFSKGAIIPEMPGNVARSMIGRHMVEEVKDDAQAPSSAPEAIPPAPLMAAIAAPMNRMLPLPGRVETNTPRHARRR